MCIVVAATHGIDELLIEIRRAVKQLAFVGLDLGKLLSRA